MSDTIHGVPLPKCASVDSQKPNGAVLQATRNVSSPTCALNKLAEDSDQRHAKPLLSFARGVGRWLRKMCDVENNSF